jgi:hypothetical protein
MSDRQGVWANPGNDPMEGHDATALQLRAELESAEFLLEIARIPVVTKNSQDGESILNRL